MERTKQLMFRSTQLSQAVDQRLRNLRDNEA
jgi:hypothetical protein